MIRIVPTTHFTWFFINRCFCCCLWNCLDLFHRLSHRWCARSLCRARRVYLWNNLSDSLSLSSTVVWLAVFLSNWLFERRRCCWISYFLSFWIYKFDSYYKQTFLHTKSCWLGCHFISICFSLRSRSILKIFWNIFWPIFVISHAKL